MTKGFRPIFTITNRITTGLTHIERARGFPEATALSEDWVGEMSRRALIREAHYTTHIVGYALEHGNFNIQNFIRICPEVNRRSLQRNLKAMIEKGVLIEEATSSTDPTKRYVLPGFKKSSKK